ncbi:ferritin-like domain-containing protein [Kribbella sp. NBC_01245]|uniref:ferritin-like domain-containing protein n=1 Tax=Kribbella sp. NBC_01245 TaxID=2903578 RepID=UPI002E2C6D32|nr:ferritin-like domain-containing protein [Kribbella sp. NBC_01245]
MSEIDALQACLAGEHAAIYAIGVAGGNLKGSRFGAARQLYAAHELRRDRLIDLITAAKAKPVAPEPAYDLPAPVTGQPAATALIRLVEQRLAVVYGDLTAGAESKETRTFAVQAGIAAAREQINWGGAPAALPLG